MLTLQEQKDNIRYTIHHSLDIFLYTAIPLFKNIEPFYSKISYLKEESSLFQSSLDFKEDSDMADSSELDDIDLVFRALGSHKEKNTSFSSFLEELYETAPNFKEIDVVSLVKERVINLVNKFYVTKVNNATIREAYCRLVKDVLNLGKYKGNLTLDFLKNDLDTQPFKDSISARFLDHEFKELSLLPYIKQIVQEQNEVKYLVDNINTIINNVSLIHRFKEFKSDSLFLGYTHPFKVTSTEIHKLYHHIGKDHTTLFDFLFTIYEVYDVDKETKERYVKDRFYPIYKLSDKSFVTKLIKQFKSSKKYKNKKLTYKTL